MPNDEDAQISDFGNPQKGLPSWLEIFAQLSNT